MCVLTSQMGGFFMMKSSVAKAMEDEGRWLYMTELDHRLSEKVVAKPVRLSNPVENENLHKYHPVYPDAGSFKARFKQGMVKKAGM